VDRHLLKTVCQSPAQTAATAIPCQTSVSGKAPIAHTTARVRRVRFHVICSPQFYLFGRVIYNVLTNSSFYQFFLLVFRKFGLNNAVSIHSKKSWLSTRHFYICKDNIYKLTPESVSFTYIIL